MTARRRRLVSAAALVAGVALLAATLRHADLPLLGRVARQLGMALPFVLVPGLLWHLMRTIAWQLCFPAGERPGLWRLFRVRLAAEAFSFVTIRGVAGEPLKVVLLSGAVRSDISAAAVALERLAYLMVTALIMAFASFLAVATLNLSVAWFRIFTGLAVFSALLTAGAFYLLRRARAAGSRAVRPAGRSPLRAFVHALDSQVRDLVLAERRPLFTLLALEAGAYVMMALEVWAALRAVNVPVTIPAAFAAETFTRAASMASAFIPANIGALEASNAAAAVAVQAAGGAAALALVRRLRGLLWCAAGFAVYPRESRRPAATADSANVLVVVDDPAIELDGTERIAGLPVVERTVRAAGRAGYSRVIVWSPSRMRAWASAAGKGRVRRIDAVPDAGAFIALLRALPEGQAITLMDGALLPSPAAFGDPAGLHASLDLSGKSLLVRTRADLANAGRLLRQSVFKPTDGSTARFNRRISLPITIALLRWTPVTANAMSLFIIGLGVYSGWLFSRGTYPHAVLAALVSLAASILDGCDGELARLRYEDSAFGCWLDTIGDYSYYFAVFGGITIGAVRQTGRPELWWIGAALAAGCMLTFALLILLRARITGGRPERLRVAASAHYESRGTWARLAARLAPVATRATLPYGILAFALARQLPLFMTLAAVGANLYWIGLVLEFRRLTNGFVGPVAVSR